VKHIGKFTTNIEMEDWHCCLLSLQKNRGHASKVCEVKKFVVQRVMDGDNAVFVEL
jgi:hypothetical protein